MRFPLAVVAGTLALVAFAGTGQAASPCWHEVLSEWAAGRGGTTHPPECYRDAMAKAPLDLKLYSSVEDDLQRALAAAAQRGNRPHAEKVRTPAGRRDAASAVPSASSGSTPVAVPALAFALAIVLGAVLLRRRQAR